MFLQPFFVRGRAGHGARQHSLDKYGRRSVVVLRDVVEDEIGCCERSAFMVEHVDHRGA